MAIVEAIVAGQRAVTRRNWPLYAIKRCDQAQRRWSSRCRQLPSPSTTVHTQTVAHLLQAPSGPDGRLRPGDRTAHALTQRQNRSNPKMGPCHLPDPRVQKRRKNQFHFQMSPELARIFGVDPTAIPGNFQRALTAHTLLAEIGPDSEPFPRSSSLPAGFALCPASNKSGGKVLSSKTRQTNRGASCALRIAAQTLARSRSRLGSFLPQHVRARLGGPQAITATAPQTGTYRLPSAHHWHSLTMKPCSSNKNANKLNDTRSDSAIKQKN